MSRLTKRGIKQEGMIWFVDHENNGMSLEPCEMNPHHNRVTLEKLADYEDKEEQGLMISAPCKIGDKAWVIDDDYEYPKKKKVYEAKWIRVSLVQTKLNNSFELRGEVSYQVYDCFYNDGRTMLHGMYVGQETTKVGERVFLTEAEAEEALAKMGGK